MASKDLKSDPASAIAVRKANDVVGVRIRQGRLTLLSRKLFNVMLGHAQMLKEPGRNAPSGVSGAEHYFWLPLSTIVVDADFNSHDTKTLQESAQSIQGIQVVLEDAKQWRSEALVASVMLAYPHGKGPGKPVWFGWSFPPGVHELVIRPSAYTQLSLYYQRLFRSGTALALWEICRQYATSPGHRTPERDLKDWFHKLSGKPISAELPPFKYWKRDDLKPAIAEVNAVSDIEIEMIEKRVGRRVMSLHFKTQMRRQESLDIPAPALIDSSLLEPMMSLGLSQREASEFLAGYDAIQLRGAIDALRKRIMNTKLGPVRSRRAYLGTVLKGGVADKDASTEKTSALSHASQEDATESLREEFANYRRAQGKALLAEMPEADREAAFNRYLRDAAPEQMRVTMRKAGPLSIVASSFHHWFSVETWGSPKDEDILQFAATRITPA